MNSFSDHPIWPFSRLAFCSLLWLGAVTSAQAQTAEPVKTFELSGRVVAKTKYGFEVETQDGKTLEIAANESTDFALRLSSPWFDVEKWKVVVDGTRDSNGRRERIRYDLPEGKLYLLTQFRTPSQRDRTLNKSPWRINNYLVSDEPIDAIVPENEDLLLAGELDLNKLELLVGDQSYPIILGYRGATLRGRSIADIVPQETVVLVSGTEVNGTKTAETVLFMIK